VAPVWFWIWTALVLGAALVAFFVWRDAWRRLRRAGSEAGTSAERLGQVWERVTARTEERLAEAPSTAPTVTAPRAELSARVDRLREERLARKAWRRRPRPEVWERWRSVWR
jgi:flagellar biosynthesis/type III secretory pathway M-ring protein FliF/YscJ